jgi:hypothetical protein
MAIPICCVCHRPMEEREEFSNSTTFGCECGCEVSMPHAAIRKHRLTDEQVEERQKDAERILRATCNSKQTLAPFVCIGCMNVFFIYGGSEEFIPKCCCYCAMVFDNPGLREYPLDQDNPE